MYLVSLLKSIDANNAKLLLLQTHHLNEDIIDKFKDAWDWWYLSGKDDLPWSIDFIERYKDKWDWERLSSNGALPWSVQLIEKYKDLWEWKALSSNDALPWSIEFIGKYEIYWHWEKLTENELPWSIELLDKYKDKWNWNDEWFWGGTEYNHRPLIKIKNYHGRLNLLKSFKII